MYYLNLYKLAMFRFKLVAYIQVARYTIHLLARSIFILLRVCSLCEPVNYCDLGWTLELIAFVCHCPIG